jgi:hypothetical protein
VTLAWDPTPSPCLTEFGYNIYRGEKQSSYSAQPVNKQLIKEPTYTDTTVLAGKTYYYVVQAKCGNNESAVVRKNKFERLLRSCRNLV